MRLGPDTRLHYLPTVAALLATAFMFSPAAAQESEPAPADNDRTADAIQYAEGPADVLQAAIDQAHLEAVSDPYPSAKKCAECHPQHYREWSVSPHAYAQMSPVFNTMQNAVKILTNGTNGDFCIRCHTPVGMDRNEPTTMTNMDRHPASREGITCIACHRVNKVYGKGAGRRKLVPGDITQPLFGPTGSSVLRDIVSDPEKYGMVRTELDDNFRSRELHGKLERFFEMASPSFCGSCHDVFGPNGFRLEDLFSEYKASPAAREGITCQDCHMGKVPGEPGGYDIGPIARVGNADTPKRKRTNHMMAGPDYSIVHPGIFPHNIEAVREENASELDTGLATMREWLKFDIDAKWGQDQFESNLPADYEFPEAWQDQARRLEARRILNDQFQLLAEYREAATKVMQVGFQLGDITGMSSGPDGLHFGIDVRNGTPGHGTPTGFDAERLIYLDVRVTDRTGRMVFRSGDLDPNGDVRDAHSFYVHNGRLPADRQLFSLQSRFVTRNVRGGEREQILPINISSDPLPFLRPLPRPMNVLGRPLGARKHKQNIEVGGVRRANYHVSSRYLSGQGPYNVSVTLRAGMVPVNLIGRISIAGFDYGLSAKEVARRVVDGHLILHEREARFGVHTN